MPVSISGTSGITFPDGSLQTAAASPLVLRNRIINGDMRIDQRNAGASGSGLTYTVDRFGFFSNQSGKFNWQRNAGSVTPPDGFTNYLGFTSTSAFSIGASDYFNFYQMIEGFNIADLGWGTANAKTVTLSFQVRSSLTGTFGGFLINGSDTRVYTFGYTISSANTWTTISITIPGDTSGTWASNNTTGVAIYWSLGAGSSTTGTGGAWGSTVNRSVTGQVNVSGTNGATFYITGVQLEQNTSATPFERRLYNQELANCQRYCQVFTDTSGGYVLGVANTVSSLRCPLQLQPMRGSPTATYTANTTFASGFRACSSIASIAADAGSLLVGFVPTVNYAVADADYLQILSNGRITVSAEL
jgi:hypothetical protein